MFVLPNQFSHKYYKYGKKHKVLKSPRLITFVIIEYTSGS